MGEGQGVCGKSLYLPLNFTVNLKLLYKIKVCLKNNSKNEQAWAGDQFWPMRHREVCRGLPGERSSP